MINKIINYNELKEGSVLVDVRSPGEFEECHIPGAINIPLFTNQEREVIGTAYKQESQDKAKKLGIEYCSKKLPEIFENFCSLKKQYKNVVVYCARGGMRSGSICSLLNSLGVNVYQLNGGYKGYRAIVNQQLPQVVNSVKFIVLHGYTGVGKTEILKKLSHKGLDVLDLEGCANHRGSFLGDVGVGQCNSQKHFEELVFETLKNRKTDYIFVEAESKRIGGIIMGDYIKDRMNNGLHLLVEASIENRTKYIVNEYTIGSNFQEEIISGLNKIRKYMGSTKVDEFIEMVRQENYYQVALELMEKYYDPMYEHTQKEYKYELVINADDLEVAAEQIANWARRVI